MVKKIMQDVVSIKKEPHGNSRTVNSGEKITKHSVSPVESFPEKKEFRKATKQVEEILPEMERDEQKIKDEVLESSPIFAKLKQRHDERESFSEEYAAGHNKLWKTYFVKGIFAAVILIVFGIVVWSTAFYSAFISIHLKHSKVALNNQEFHSAADTPDLVPYQIMSLSEQASVKITPTGEKRVTQKASGPIVVYNNFKTQPQILVKNTRFESADGKIYRIDRQIVIPGIKKVSGKDVPGSVEVTVYADEAGSDYNIGLTDFTIPGFKGSPQYQKFYGRSKAAMKGGASGMIKTISDADREAAKTSLTKSLTDKLTAKAKTQKPKGTVLYPKAMFFTFIDSVDDNAASTEKDVSFTLKGELGVILFNEDELSRSIVKTNGEVTADEKIAIDKIESLDFEWKIPMSSVPDKTATLDFTLSGPANAVWVVDINSFKNKLAGTSNSGYPKIVSEFPGIEKVTKNSISPFWMNTYPKDTTKIYIETIID